MSRLADRRDDHLTPSEIAHEALRQFDDQPKVPSIRTLASALRVSPMAIYHHYPTHAAIVRAAVDLVFDEVTLDLVTELGNPFSADADAVQVLLYSGLATRRAFLRHFRIAPYMAAQPKANEWTSATLELVTALFDRLGLKGEPAAQAYHTYASFVLGSALFAARRKLADEQLGHPGAATGPFGSARRVGDPGALAATRRMLDEVMDLSATDPARDEALFSSGLQLLINAVIVGSAS